MGTEWFKGQARSRRLAPALPLRINGTFKRFRYKSSPQFLPNHEISMASADLPATRLALAADGRRRFFRFVLFLIGFMFGVLALRASAGADQSRTLIIPPNDGYGFEECLTPGSQCGLVVADAWCKAHGFAGSQGFGPETTGTAGVPPGSVRVICAGAVD
jgi:hypothetical protein